MFLRTYKSQDKNKFTEMTPVFMINMSLQQSISYKMLKIKHGVHVDSIITFSGELNVVAVLDSKPILDLRICFYE